MSTRRSSAIAVGSIEASASIGPPLTTILALESFHSQRASPAESEQDREKPGLAPPDFLAVDRVYASAGARAAEQSRFDAVRRIDHPGHSKRSEQRGVEPIAATDAIELEVMPEKTADQCDANLERIDQSDRER